MGQELIDGMWWEKMILGGMGYMEKNTISTEQIKSKSIDKTFKKLNTKYASAILTKLQTIPRYYLLFDWMIEKEETFQNKSSKDRTWSAVPDALLGVISWRSGVRAGQRPQRADVL